MPESSTPTRADRLLRPLQEFLRLEAAGGLILMAAAVLAMIVANSPLKDVYNGFLATPFTIQLGDAGISKAVILWINDGLMAVFFLLIGMELKREMAEGHLSTLRRAALPAFAAVGGMIAPALIFVAFNRNDPIALQGWAIPAATDIAFALGVLSLLGPRVPAVLKAFLLSVAIFDDLGVIVVIALFYSSHLSLVALAIAGLVLIALALLNRAGVTRPMGYMLLGLVLWVALLKSGVHATLAGVAVAMFIPLTKPGDAAVSPLRDLEHVLHPWVAYGILPVFAFANAGVPLAGFALADLLHPVPLGIIAGLFIGKQLGIVLLAFLAVRLGLGALPAGTKWSQLHAVAVVGGIGFTMSLFIASLAAGDGGEVYFELERLGILLGSLLSGVVGYFLLKWRLKEE